MFKKMFKQVQFLAVPATLSLLLTVPPLAAAPARSEEQTGPQKYLSRPKATSAALGREIPVMSMIRRAPLH